MNEILARYSNLGCRFFLFSILNISCHSLLACRASAERSAVEHIELPLYVTYCFSLAAFNILFLCLVFVWSVCALVCFSLVYPVWNSLCLLDLIGYFLFHVGEIFNYNLFKNFLIPFLSSGTPIIQLLVHLIWSQRSLTLSSALFIFTLFCSSELISIILSSELIDLFFCLRYSAIDSF